MFQNWNVFYVRKLIFLSTLRLKTTSRFSSLTSLYSEAGARGSPLVTSQSLPLGLRSLTFYSPALPLMLL